MKRFVAILTLLSASCSGNEGQNDPFSLGEGEEACISADASCYHTKDCLLPSPVPGQSCGDLGFVYMPGENCERTDVWYASADCNSPNNITNNANNTNNTNNQSVSFPSQGKWFNQFELTSAFNMDGEYWLREVDGNIVVDWANRAGESERLVQVSPDGNAGMTNLVQDLSFADLPSHLRNRGAISDDGSVLYGLRCGQDGQPMQLVSNSAMDPDFLDLTVISDLTTLTEEGCDLRTGAGVRTNDGGFLILGGKRVLANIGNSKLVAVRTDEDLNVIWEKTYDAVAGFQGWELKRGLNANVVIEQSDGGFLIAAPALRPFNNNPEFAPVVMKIGNDGDVVWQEVLSIPGGSREKLAYPREIAVSPSGKIYVGVYWDYVTQVSVNGVLMVYRLDNDGALELGPLELLNPANGLVETHPRFAFANDGSLLVYAASRWPVVGNMTEDFRYAESNFTTPNAAPFAVTGNCHNRQTGICSDSDDPNFQESCQDEYSEGPCSLPGQMAICTSAEGTSNVDGVTPIRLNLYWDQTVCGIDSFTDIAGTCETLGGNYNGPPDACLNF